MTKPKKVPTGWQVQVYLGKDRQGKSHFKTITRPYKWEVIQEAEKLECSQTRTSLSDKTVGDAVDDYIAICSQLSPTTVPSYESIRRCDFQELMNVKIANLSDEIIQRHIDMESERTTRKGTKISPTTIKKHWGLLSTAIYKATGVRYTPNLPKLKPKFVELPEPQVIADAVKGSEVELIVAMSMGLSFTMSELRGLKCSSIRNGKIYIEQVVVDVGGQPVVKANAKEQMRNRVLTLPPYLLKRLKKYPPYKEYLKSGVDQFLFPQPAYYYTSRFNKLMKENGIADFNFHKLRHENCSVMCRLNIPMLYQKSRGGWQTDSTPQMIYSHTFSTTRNEIDKVVDNYFENIFE